MAALEANIVDPNATVFCPGHYDLGEHRFHCWKKGGHGHVNLKQAMAGSCDTYFYDLGKRVGAPAACDVLAHGAWPKSLGLICRMNDRGWSQVAHGSLRAAAFGDKAKG